MKRNFNQYASTILIIAILVLSAGCGLKIGNRSSYSEKKMSASFYLLSETEKKSIDLKIGETITFEYKIKLKKGIINSKLVDPDGKEIEKFEPNTSGTKKIKIEKDGDYELIIKGSNARGSYSFKWDIKLR